MARPLKYSSQQERLTACGRVQMLVREMKDMSGWTTDELANAMKLDISGGMLRQYLAGKKPASEQRLTDLAREAVRLHCTGKMTAEILFWSEWPRQGATIFSADREGGRARARLEQALVSLLALGYTSTDLIYMAAVKLKSLVPLHEQADGGIVDPLTLPGSNISTEDQSPVWVTLQIKPWP